MIAGRWSRARSRRVKPFWHIALMVGLTASVLFGRPATADGAVDGLDRDVTLNIPAQPLSKALVQFGQQAKVQMMLSPNAGDGQTSKALKGTLRASEALNTLLHGSGLSYQSQDNTVTVSSAAAQAVAATRPFRLAEGATGLLEHDNTDEGTAESGQETTNSPSSKRQFLEEVVVTGSNIRGGNISTSPILQFNRDAIDRSGYLNTQDFIQSIPQAFAGGALGASQDGALGPGSTAATNNEHASAINLRGLGENATLILLNGHRIAPSDYGQVVDVSTIPLSAIDHIDVLTDGASAIYGADAVAGVVNIILRKDFDGLQTRASYGGASGGLRNEILNQTFGAGWNTGSLMGSYEYQHESSLPTSARPFAADASQPTNILNPFTQHSLVLNGHQRIADAVNLFGDVLATWKKTGSELTYAPGYGVSSFSNPSAINAHMGLSVAVSENWDVELSGTYARQKTDIGFNSYPLDVPLGRPIIFFTARTPEYGINITGRPLRLPGGDVGFAIGASRREEHGKTVYSTPDALFQPAPIISIDRDITAEYAELRLPVLGAENKIPLVEHLVVSAAIRHDRYSDFGGTTNPKVGALWSPASFIDVKANWSRAFRAPSLGELWSNADAGAGIAEIYAFADPSGPGTVPTLLVLGSNPHLGAETASTYDVALDIHPTDIPGLKISLDYYNVVFKNRIELPPFDTNALLHPNVYGPLIQQFTNDAQSAAYLSNLQQRGYQLIDAGEGYGTSVAGVRYAYPYYELNAAIVRQNGFDLTEQYAFQLGSEAFRTSLNAALINKIDTQFASGATVTNLVNKYANPLRLRLRWEGGWSHGPAELTGAVNFSNSYSNPFSTPPATIASFTTIDLSGALSLANDSPSSFLHGTTIRLNAVNLFNRYPPYASGGTALLGIHYDVGNASPIGRMLSVELRKTW